MMTMTLLAETILIDALDGGHMWSQAENRPTVDMLMDLGYIEALEIRSATGDMFRTPRCISHPGVVLARELKADRAGTC